MSRLDRLREKVDTLYQTRDKEATAELAEYLYTNHVFVVTDIAGRLAERFGANKEYSMAAAMLHDIADATMKRHDPRHAQESANIARRFLEETGYDKDEITIILDDAIANHSCHGEDRPKTLEGKVMATADAVAHLSTGFSEGLVKAFLARGEAPTKVRVWGLEHLERDLNVKVFFDDVREEMRPHYERLKKMFESLV